MYFKTFSKSECCACTACEHTCPVKAIKFFPDEEGFMYPSIDKTLCINCGLCERVCPIEHSNYNNKSPEVYAALLKDVEQRKRSSSGGLFYAIAHWVLTQKGKIYGATIDANHQVKHIGVDKFEDLYLLRGSKYVQSNLQHVYADIKNELKNDRWCYFVGTGCQVAGLKAFLRKDYKTLLTSDLVCHGVPSQWLFEQHIQYIEEKYHGKVSDYQFRNNESWAVCEIFNLTNREGKVKTIKHHSYSLSPFLYSFMYAMTYRHSCYNCKFACIPRQGDITLADYWGVQHFFPEINANNGVSLVLVNSEKGNNVFRFLEQDIDIKKSNLEDGAKFNMNLISETKKHPNRDVAYNVVKREGYKVAAQTIFKDPYYLKHVVLQKILNNRFFAFLIDLRVKSNYDATM